MTPPNQEKKVKVAVLGLGAHGVPAVKNLHEAGFDVAGFDKNEYIGGLWQWNNDTTQTTVLKSTRANISKQRNSYTDFPFPDEVPTYPSAKEMLQYIRDYATHFDLHKHFRLGYRITNLKRSSDGKQWCLAVISPAGVSEELYFDKVVVTTGSYRKPFVPEVSGSETFEGKILHAQAFKSADGYAGKRVVVVGLSNTGGDTAVDLAKIAAKVYLSHRSGARVVKRAPQEVAPIENRISRKMVSIGSVFARYFPVLSMQLATRVIERKMLKGAPYIKSSWNLLPAPPLASSFIIHNDFLLEYLRDGYVESKPGVKQIIAPRSVEFSDGTIVHDIDTIIFATGYQVDYSIMSPEANPAAKATPEWNASPHTNGLIYPRLYWGVLSAAYPTSLAFVGPFRGFSLAIFMNADLAATAIAQVFAGNFKLPPQNEIDQWCDANYALNLKSVQKWRLVKPTINAQALEQWLNAAAGNGVNECLGWSLAAWKFWWNDRKLYRLIVSGIDTPFLYRLFPGRGGRTDRQPWPGAAEAIRRVNGTI